jgi:hypothetical protein
MIVSYAVLFLGLALGICGSRMSGKTGRNLSIVGNSFLFISLAFIVCVFSLEDGAIALAISFFIAVARHIIFQEEL